MRRFASVPRRRTLKASLADLIAAHPGLLHDTLSKAQLDLWELNRDDAEARARRRRESRAWRVHDLAIVEAEPAGPSARSRRTVVRLARLSCTHADSRGHDATQFILELGTGFDGRERCRALGPVRTVARDLDAKRLRNALLWNEGALPALLADAVHGFPTARDARVAFAAQRRFLPEGHRIEARRTANAVRQSGANRDSAVAVRDHHAGISSDGYLLETNRGWYLMEVEHARLGAAVPEARFAGSHARVAFDTPVATARTLLASAPDGSREAAARDRLHALVGRDLETRLRRDRSVVPPLVTARARLPDGRVAVPVARLYAVSAHAPLEAPHPVWQILVTGPVPAGPLHPAHEGVLALPSGREAGWFTDSGDYAARFRAAVAAVGTSDDADARDVIAGLLIADLGYARRAEAEAEAAWSVLTAGAAVEVLDGDVDPVPMAFTRRQLEAAIGAQREALQSRMAAGLAAASDLDAFERHVAAGRRYPPHLLALVAELRAATVKDGRVEEAALTNGAAACHVDDKVWPAEEVDADRETPVPAGGPPDDRTPLAGPDSNGRPRDGKAAGTACHGDGNPRPHDGDAAGRAPAAEASRHVDEKTARRGRPPVYGTEDERQAATRARKAAWARAARQAGKLREPAERLRERQRRHRARPTPAGETAEE